MVNYHGLRLPLIRPSGTFSRREKGTASSILCFVRGGSGGGIVAEFVLGVVLPHAAVGPGRAAGDRDRALVGGADHAAIHCEQVAAQVVAGWCGIRGDAA